jgi:hypothetical protein
MPPRRSARLAAAAAEAQPSALAPLPLALAQRILLLLPVDQLVRAACVCRAWRDALSDPTLWTRLDLSNDSGVALGPTRITADALLLGAARRAQGLLGALDVTGEVATRTTPAVLLAVVAAHAASLRELRVGQVIVGNGHGILPSANELALAAPRLLFLDAHVSCHWAAAPQLMRAEPPFTALRLRELSLYDRDNVGGLPVPVGLEHLAPFAAALADAALQPTLACVRISLLDVQQPAVLDALVDAALARRLRSLALPECTRPAAAPLARLLRGGALQALEIFAPLRAEPLFDAAGAATVANALRATSALTTLQLRSTGLCLDAHAAGVILTALVGHRSLRVIDVSGEAPADATALGAALGALLAADAPALQALSADRNALGDAGLAPLVAALPRCRHLRELHIAGNDMSAAFAHEQLLPAVRANASLQTLGCVDFRIGEDMFLFGEGTPAAAAEQLVRRRAQRG